MTAGADAAEFERLVRPHLDRLYRLAWRLTGAEADAEDLFQDVMVKACADLESLAGVDEPGPWLSRLMYNRFVDGHRRRARQRLVVVDEGRLDADGVAGLAGDDDPVRASDSEQVAAILENALARLSEEHRIVVLLHDADGYKLKEIQELTGTPVGTLKSRLHRARARLRELLGATDGTLPGGAACTGTERDD